MRSFPKTIFTTLFITLIIFIIFYRDSIENSNLVNSISDEILHLTEGTEKSDKENIKNSQAVAHFENNDNNTTGPVFPRLRRYAPITIELLEREDEKLIALLKNKDTTWLQIRKQQSKIRLIKKKFELPLVNHESWPETVLIHLIHRENFQIEEIDRAKSYMDFNLSKRDIENLAKPAVHIPPAAVSY